MRNLGTKDGVLPPNPEWITFDNTDGDSRRWPTNTHPVLDAEGHVNYMQLLSDDHPSAIKWRVQCGASIAELLKLPNYQTKNYVLKTWPAGYQFYDHNKGPASNPRHDLYLVGSELVARFRSPQELTPHAVWLLQDGTKDRANCTCKYCSKRPQREITQGLPRTDSPSSQRVRDKKRARPVREQNPLRLQATVRRVPKPLKLPKGPRQFSVPERERDLLAIATAFDYNGPKEPRWARNGELLWVYMKHPVPLHVHGNANQGIIFWPGLVQGFELKITATKREDASMDEGNATGEDDCLWDIKHLNLFQVRLLVANQDVRVDESQLLPYQAYAPSSDLINAIQQVKVPIQTFPGLEDIQEADSEALARFSQFEPHLNGNQILSTEEVEVRISEAIPAFALAIQIASRLTTYWTPFEAWECRLTPSTTSESRLEQPSLSTIGSSSWPPPMMSSFSTTHGGVTQMRFQGLWWGPERVWVGDLVRLKLGRHQFVPNGSELVAKLAHSRREPNKENEDVEMADATDQSSPGKGLFLRVDSIYAENRENSPFGKPTAMMSGMVYELVDENWEEEKEGVDVGLPPMSSGTAGSFPIEKTPLFMPNPALLTAQPASASSDSSDDGLNLVGEVIPRTESKGKGREVIPSVPVIPPPRRSTFKPSQKGVGPPPTAASLSGPSPPYTYRLPAPPLGHKFRPILPTSHEATMSVVLLSGRYYPGILQHPLMLPFIEAASLDAGAETDDTHAPLWALECHVSGVHNAVDPTVWMSNRVGMVRAGAETAKGELLAYWKDREAQAPPHTVLPTYLPAPSDDPDPEIIDVDG